MARSRSVLALLVALVTAMMLAVPPSGGGEASAAAGPSRVERYDVAPGVVREGYRYTTGNGASDVEVLRFHLDDQRVELAAELANGVVAGRETVPATLRRLGEDAVAGVNASFSNPACRPTDPYGEPCGLFVHGDILMSENTLNGSEWPGGFALFDPTEDWREPWDVARVGFEGYLRFRDGYCIEIDAIDRQLTEPAYRPYPCNDPGRSSEQLAVFNSGYGGSTGTPAGTVEFLLEGFELKALTQTEFALPDNATTSGNRKIPAGSTVLSARGAAGDALLSRVGHSVELKAYTAGLEWAGAREAVAAGPMIIQDGRSTSAESWENEGFSAGHHNSSLHPRTIVGFTAEGEMLLVTVDGRRTDSVGISTGQAVELMQSFGAVDAVMMDGGGSTNMAVDGLSVNIPSDGQPRPVASSLVLHTKVPTPDVTRLQGGDRYATAARVALHGWPEGADRVVIASGERFPDALTGGPLAADRDAPLLLTAGGSVPTATLDALASLGTTQVTLIGGTSAISEDVEKALSDRGLQVDRIAGDDRTATAAAVARHIGAPKGRVFLASAATFPDALSAIVPAARSDAPLLLTWPDHLSDATASALGALNVEEVVVAGGPAALSDAVESDIESRGYPVTRVAGNDRYETSVKLVDWAAAHTGLATSTVALATGADFPDALAGGPFAARTQTPVLLTHRHDVDASAAVGGWLDRHDLSSGVLLGGPVALAGWHRFELQQHIDAQ